MKDYIVERAIQIDNYIIENNAAGNSRKIVNSPQNIQWYCGNIKSWKLFSTFTVTMQNPFKIAFGDGILHS